MKVASFTGHRPQHLKGLEVESRYGISRLIDEAVSEGYTHFINGMACGVDLWAAEEVIKRNLYLICCIPFKGQDAIWPEQTQQQYRKILHEVNRGNLKGKVLVLNDKHTKDMTKAEISKSLLDRSKFVVDQSSLILGVWLKSKVKGGTANTINYAHSKKKEIWFCDPSAPAPDNLFAVES
jgi:uncharacterized phage-like protein YoqJ